MSPELISLEMLARGVAIGALLTMGAALWRSNGGRSARIAAAMFCAGVIAYVINSSPQLIAAFSPIMAPIHFMALGGVGLFWLFIVTLFEDRALSARTLWPWAALTGLGLVGWAAPPPMRNPIWLAHNSIEAAFAAHALFVIWRSWRGDLVESRRRLRGPFLAIVTMYVIVLSGFEMAEELGFFEPWFRLLGAATLALSSVTGAVVFLQAREHLFGAAQPQLAAAPGLGAGDRAALQKLEQLMGPGEAWRREGLTIGALAGEVGLPEHRLRPLINDHLGFRNFAAFVNARRIEAAKALLRDPKHARQTVAAIAYDLGFGSLGPFNRAFKEATGATPTEFRRAAGSPNPEIAD
ncbi:MAG: AraC family transcriptional regulator [Hyphomonadaceae bacterium]